MTLQQHEKGCFLNSNRGPIWQQNQTWQPDTVSELDKNMFNPPKHARCVLQKSSPIGLLVFPNYKNMKRQKFPELL